MELNTLGVLRAITCPESVFLTRLLLLLILSLSHRLVPWLEVLAVVVDCKISSFSSGCLRLGTARLIDHGKVRSVVKCARSGLIGDLGTFQALPALFQDPRQVLHIALVLKRSLPLLLLERSVALARVVQLTGRVR